jgi:hypothetical protein
MIGYVGTTGLFATLATFQVVGGIEGLASWAGVVSPDLFEPLLIPNRLDSFKIDPKFDPVRHCRLKLFEVTAGILSTFAAKVDAPFRRTSEHSAFFAVKQSFVGPASIASAIFHGPISLFRKSFEPFMVFCRGNKPRACLTVKTAYSGKFFIRFLQVIFTLFHGNPVKAHKLVKFISSERSFDSLLMNQSNVTPQKK